MAGNVVAIAGVELQEVTGESAYAGVAEPIVAADARGRRVPARPRRELAARRARGHARGAPRDPRGLRGAPGGRATCCSCSRWRLRRTACSSRPASTSRAGVDSERVEDVSSEIELAIRRRVPAVAEVFLDATDRDRFARAKREPLGVFRSAHIAA